MSVTLCSFGDSPDHRTENHSPTSVGAMVSLPSQSSFPTASNLGDDLVSELCVLDHSLGQTRWKKSDVSLKLMQHSIGAGQLHFLLHAGGQ